MKQKTLVIAKQPEADPKDAAATEILEILNGFTRFEQNKIIGVVLEANAAERRLEIKRVNGERDVCAASSEELMSILKNQSVL